MNLPNSYYKTAVIGAIATLLLQLVLALAIDPYVASALTPLYPVWIVIFVVGWRKQHPRR